MMKEGMTHVHKQQRKALFSLASKVGDADFSDSIILIDVYNDLMRMTKELREHAFNEETFIHPLLARKMPNSARMQHEEHVEMKKYLEDLEKNFQHLQELSPHYKKLQQQGLEFYLMLNRFISTYLMHINEEEYVMQNVYELSLEVEWKAMLIAFQTYDGVEKGEKWLMTELPGMSLDEQKLMFKTTQLFAPENIFLTMCQLAEKILGPEKIQKII